MIPRKAFRSRYNLTYSFSCIAYTPIYTHFMLFHTEKYTFLWWKSYPQSKSCISSSFYHISCVCRWIMWITLGITLFIVCVKHGETVGKYGFLCGNRKFCGFFIHILADFAVSFWAFLVFFLLFLVLPVLSVLFYRHIQFQEINVAVFS